MTPARLVISLLVIFLVALPPAQAQKGQPAPALDAFGDALPAGVTARMGTTRLRHAGKVIEVKFAPDGKRVVSSGDDGTVRLWDVATGKELGRFAGSKPRLSGDGKTLVTWDSGLRAWDLATGKELPWSSKRPGNADFRDVEIAISQDGKFITIAGDVWQRARGLPGDPNVKAPVAPQGIIQCWEIATGKLLYEHTEAWIGTYPAFHISPEGNAVLHPEKQERWLVRELPTGKVLQRWDYEDRPSFLPDGKRMCGYLHEPDKQNNAGRMVVKDLATGKKQFRVVTPKGYFADLSPDGKTVAIANFENGDKDEKSIVRLQDAGTGNKLREFPSFPKGHENVRFSPDGKKLIVVGAWQSAIDVWETATGKNLCRLDFWRAQFYTIDISADSKLLAISDGHSSVIRIYDLSAGKRVPDLAALDLPCEAMRFSPDSKSLAAIDPLGAWVWPTTANEKPKQLRTFAAKGQYHGLLRDWRDPHSFAEPLLTWDQRGHLLLVAASNWEYQNRPNQEFPEGWVQVVDLTTGKRLRYMDKANAPMTAWTLSTDGKTLAGIVGLRLHLWDIASGKELIKLEEADIVYQSGLSLSPNGKTVAARCFRDNYSGFNSTPKSQRTAWIMLWELTTGKLRNRFEWQIDPIGYWRSYDGPIGPPGSNALYADNYTGIVYAPDGRTLALPSGDNIILWNSAQGKEIRRVGGNNIQSETAAFSPDGKLVAALTTDGSVCLWEVATGTLLRQVQNAPVKFVRFCFSPDGKHIATAGNDTAVLLWDVTQLLVPGKAALPADALEALWKDLASDDATRAGNAITALSEQGPVAMAFLQKHLQPIAPPDPKHIQRLLADLESDKFAVREKAMQALENLGDLASPALQQLSESRPPLETRLRVEKLQDKLAGPVRLPEVLRMLRAMEALEQIGGLSACQVLEAVANGAPGHRVTVAAQETVARLRNRQLQ